MNNCKIGTYDRRELTGASVGTGGATQVGSLQLANAGIWLVRVNHRSQFNNSSNFLHMGLYTSSTNGSGRLTNDSNIWLQEHPTTNGTGGVDTHGEWLVNAGTDQSYTLTLYVHIYAYSRTMSTFYTTNDSNGVPDVTALCIKGTTSTGISTIDTV